YNAALALLGWQDKLLEYGPPFPEPARAGTSSPTAPASGDLRPVVWVSVVGRSGPWPLHYTPAVEDKTVYARAAPPFPVGAEEAGHYAARVTPRHTGLWLSGLAALGLFCLALLYAGHALPGSDLGVAARDSGRWRLFEAFFWACGRRPFTRAERVYLCFTFL